MQAIVYLINTVLLERSILNKIKSRFSDVKMYVTQIRIRLLAMPVDLRRTFCRGAF